MDTQAFNTTGAYERLGYRPFKLVFIKCRPKLSIIPNNRGHSHPTPDDLRSYLQLSSYMRLRADGQNEGWSGLSVLMWGWNSCLDSQVD